ncbi:MAG TPA: replication-relaxation family protein [Acidimicrobiales bacterium]|nr:replication-relaxation family protein [Acidimicrobiales bacterium]
MSTPRKGRRQLLRLQAELSERDCELLGSVHRLRLASTRQLERLHFPVPPRASRLSAARSCRRTLERLVRERALVRLQRRIGGVRAGSASYVYAIGPVGQRLLGGSGPRRRFREPSGLFVAHTLAVSELCVQLQETARRGELQVVRLETEPQCWRTSTGLGGLSWLRPDFFVVLLAGGYEYRWFVEVDLGTEHTPAILRKCRNYEAYYRSGVEQDRHGVFPRALWVAPDEQRAGRIGSAFRQATGITEGLFVVTAAGRAIEVLAGGQT